MKRLVLLALALVGIRCAEARQIGLGIDAFNRSVPLSATAAAAFSPLSFEIDCVTLAESVDPIRRARFTEALHVMDEFSAEYSSLARMPLEGSATNGVDLAWAHLVVVNESRRVDPAYRLAVQSLYGVEICGAPFARGIRAWVRTLFAGAFDDWSLPPLPKGDFYALHDIVSVTAVSAPTNGWKRLCPTHTVYRIPLVGGSDFYALAPKSGRALASVRSRLTSVTLPEILSMSAAVVDPPVPVRLSLPPMDIVATNELAGAFSYFRLPTTSLKPFPPGTHPSLLRQTVRFRLRSAAPLPDAEPLEGPFLFFIHDPVSGTLPVVGLHPRD